MTYTKIKNLYDTLNSNSSLTSLTDINVGWKTEDISYPSLNIIQAGGSQTGLLGYNTGNLIDETFTVQINIYSRNSLMEAYNILDVLDEIMISSGYQKTSDIDMYEDELDAHRKTTRWSYQTID